MNDPLWINEYAPTIEELPQPGFASYLDEVSDSPVNLLVYGPPGVGKTAGVQAMLDQAHEVPDADVTTINAADFFNLTKKELASDPRFTSFIDSQKRRNQSKASLMNHVLKELASYQPMGSDYQTIVIDNATQMREDFQHGLRRTMEQYHEGTQFIIIARALDSIIDPLQSRCVPRPVRAPSTEAITSVLRDIADAEELAYSDAGLEFVAGYSDHNLRKAILSLQTVATNTEEITPQTASDELQSIGINSVVGDLVSNASNGDIEEARSAVHDLLIDEGVAPETVFERIVAEVQVLFPESTTNTLIKEAADIDMQILDAENPAVHLVHYLSRIEQAAGN